MTRRDIFKQLRREMGDSDENIARTIAGMCAIAPGIAPYFDEELDDKQVESETAMCRLVFAVSLVCPPPKAADLIREAQDLFGDKSKSAEN
jgi:hypothetical protein